jgi:ABC-type multidrug transport system fused ATPase/permease subunit
LPELQRRGHQPQPFQEFSVVSIYRKIFDILEANERRRFVVLMVIMILVAFAEITGVSAVFLLLGVLSQPEMIAENAVLSWAFKAFGFVDIFNFQMAFAIAAFVVVMAGLAVKALGAYAISRFSSMRSFSLSSRLLQTYLWQPYIWFLSRNSSDISHRVLGEIDRLVNNIVIPSLRVISSAILCLAVVGFLIVVEPLTSILSAASLGGGYALIYLFLRKRLQRLGKKMLARSGDRYRLVNELSGGFREVKLLGIEGHYMSRFDKVALDFAGASATLKVMGELPRFMLEALTFAVLLMLVFVLLLRNDGNLLNAIPTLGIFAYSVMRLLPALQQIYHGVASLRAHAPALDLIHEEICESRSSAAERPADAAPNDSLALAERLDLDGLSFSYPGTKQPALTQFSISIPARKTVGFVGGTGAGKTTLIDLILGLLTPEAGQLRVDGVAVTSQNLRAWQRTVGYVPQSIYLSDDTVAANIAFGVPPENIDMAAVERAARLAALHDFIISDLTDGYDSIVGERGVRLSGGQRQRIGIARALYRNPSVLVLDEATSALDNITERVVMEAISSLRDEKTVILIAHRLTTVRDCDMIFMMERGRLIAQGRYEELVEGNEKFRRMALGQ